MTLPARRRDSATSTSSALSDLDTLTQEFARLLDLPSLGADAGITPLADVEETDDAYLVDVELPGVKKQDVDIELQDRRLVISGERRERERVGLLRRKARSTGRFYFEITLPEPVDEDQVEAHLEDGVLQVRVPKREGARRRHIDIR